jgi:hypothetical protein
MASSIGLLNEKSLHAQLKLWYARPGDRFEVPVDGYVVDIVRGDLLIEIQTGSFSSIRRKLRALCAAHPVRLVYPIPREKWIVKLPPGSRKPTSANRDRAVRRRSPKRGDATHLFEELVAFPDLVAQSGFGIEVLLTLEEELRQLGTGTRRRRRGWRTLERRLVDVVGRHAIEGPADLARMLPDALPEPFGTAELARASGGPRWLAQRMAYCLRRAGAIDEVGRARNAKLYARAPARG